MSSDAPAAREDGQIQAKDVEHIKDLVEAYTGLRMLQRMYEASRTSCEFGHLALAETKLLSPFPDRRSQCYDSRVSHLLRGSCLGPRGVICMIDHTGKISKASRPSQVCLCTITHNDARNVRELKLPATRCTMVHTYRWRPGTLVGRTGSTLR
jgi:hypothetical protein